MAVRFLLPALTLATPAVDALAPVWLPAASALKQEIGQAVTPSLGNSNSGRWVAIRAHVFSRTTDRRRRLFSASMTLVCLHARPLTYDPLYVMRVCVCVCVCVCSANPPDLLLEAANALSGESFARFSGI